MPRVKIVCREGVGTTTVVAVVCVRSARVLFACAGPDAGGAVLAAVGYCRAHGHEVVAGGAAEANAERVAA
jgi:hypothetical protein